ncbi:MAG: hypothetical protein C6Y22_01600 [Hapalosiphonaceae cyanobacterium JJU2]|nr:MAG: hypothetical protein C6Y22_01600 [Hapalosiphonaceae cyanobacterium JJU2]
MVIYSFPCPPTLPTLPDAMNRVSTLLSTHPDAMNRVSTLLSNLLRCLLSRCIGGILAKI